MKSLFSFFISFTFIHTLYGQINIIKDPALSISFTMTDFKSADNIKSGGLSKLFDFELMHVKGGLSVGYITGIHRYIDLLVSANGCFVDSPVRRFNATGKNNLLIDVTSALYFKLFTDKKLMLPFLTAGLGISNYKSFYGIHFPAGAGLQLNYKDDVYLLIQSIYSFGITNRSRDYLRHSIGIAGNIKRRKQKARSHVPVTVIAPLLKMNSDKDGDGIVDTADRCPEIPGLLSLQGCPDIDGDGIADIDDQCPALYGLLKYHGCPVPDFDKDGVIDEMDSCITVPGMLYNHGCPVLDSVSNAQITAAARQIFFQTGSARLLPKSYRALNEVSAILLSQQAYTIQIEGHTDSIGNAFYNKKLSEQRAETVMLYLIGKGILKEKISAKGWGAEHPIETNTTETGRAKNRRVEIILKDIP